MSRPMPWHRCPDSAQPLIVLAAEPAIDCATLGHRRLSQALGDPSTVGLVGQLIAERRSRVARMAAGATEACGSIPPRSRAAMCGASLVSCVALPPGMAFLERACPSPKGIPS